MERKNQELVSGLMDMADLHGLWAKIGVTRDQIEPMMLDVFETEFDLIIDAASACAINTEVGTSVNEQVMLGLICGMVIMATSQSKKTKLDPETWSLNEPES